MNLKRCPCGAKAELWQNDKTLRCGVQCDADDCTFNVEYSVDSIEDMDAGTISAAKTWNNRFTRRRQYPRYIAPVDSPESTG